MKSRTLSILTLLLVGSTFVGGVQAEAAVKTRSQVKTVSYRTISNNQYGNVDYTKFMSGNFTTDFEAMKKIIINQNNCTTVPSTPSKDQVKEPVVEQPTTEPTTKPTTQPSTGQDTSTKTPVTETPVVPEAPVVNEKFMAQVEQAIFNKVNEERAKAGVAPLTYNKTMEKYARIKSQDMGDKNYFSHQDLSGNLITTKMKADGVSYRAWGENIAYIGGVSDPTALANQFMTNWMNSEGHRKNILSTNFESIGVGVYKAGNRVYATQEFYK
ncbi:CAP domain-containing protein [Clostridium sp. UBA4395]|uniref:CAP domain-containing protein n=1 Tax=Clostridium sp. UBA4395 TaxID=1946360 RepID=UPI0032180ACB